MAELRRFLRQAQISSKLSIGWLLDLKWLLEGLQEASKGKARCAEGGPRKVNGDQALSGHRRLVYDLLLNSLEQFDSRFKASSCLKMWSLGPGREGFEALVGGSPTGAAV